MPADEPESRPDDADGGTAGSTEAEDAGQKTEIELFAAFYEKQNGRPMTEEQMRFSLALLEKEKEAAL